MSCGISGCPCPEHQITRVQVVAPESYGRPEDQWVYPGFKIRGDRLENAIDEALGDFIDTVVLILKERARMIEKTEDTQQEVSPAQSGGPSTGLAEGGLPGSTPGAAEAAGVEPTQGIGTAGSRECGMAAAPHPGSPSSTTTVQVCQACLGTKWINRLSGGNERCPSCVTAQDTAHRPHVDYAVAGCPCPACLSIHQEVSRRVHKRTSVVHECGPGCDFCARVEKEESGEDSDAS